MEIRTAFHKRLKEIQDEIVVMGSMVEKAISRAMETLKGTSFNDFVCSVNIIKFMQGMGDMMETMGDQMGPDCPPNPAFEMFKMLSNVQTQSCLVAGGKTADGTAAVRLALPKQHLIEIVSTVMQIQQKMMMQQQQQMQP